MPMQLKSPYGSVSVNYKARPHYPIELFEWLSEQVSQRSLAWDCGCGSGQGSHGLARHFENVIATDISHEQISQANPNPRVQFRCAPAHDSGLEDSSVDLVCAFMAVHWFDLEGFYREVRRVAKHDAIIALFVYGEPYIGIDKIIDNQLSRLSELIYPFGGPAIQRMRQGYEDLFFPFDEERPLPVFEMKAEMTPSTLIQYLESRASVIDHTALHGDAELRKLSKFLEETYCETECFTVKWPLNGRIASASMTGMAIDRLPAFSTALDTMAEVTST